ncbi:hypothetical protein BY996DRAFT_1718428 [Phakopsora pachyrhizi]|nr:hypothetical protein BY996DRAFT_1718428 [Phakopsora pachyrhizi]
MMNEKARKGKGSSKSNQKVGEYWISEDEEEGSDVEKQHSRQTSPSPTNQSTAATIPNLLRTPKKRSDRLTDLVLENLLKTPSSTVNNSGGRTSRSQGLVKNLTPKKSFVRLDRLGNRLEEPFRIGDQVIISSDQVTSSYFWLHRRNGFNRPKKVQDEDEAWDHQDGLEGNQKVGIIVELFEDEKGEKKAKVRWFARPKMIWFEDGPADGTPEDYEPWELCYVQDSEWFSAKKLLDHFLKSKKKITEDNMTSNEFLACTKALTQSSHAQDLIPISAILEHVKVVDWNDWPSDSNSNPSKDDQPLTRAGHRIFRCRRIYDSRPMAWDKDGFVRSIDFRGVLSRGLAEGVWDVPVEGPEIGLMDDGTVERRRAERRDQIKERNRRRRSENTGLKHMRDVNQNEEDDEDEDEENGDSEDEGRRM